MSRHGPSLLPGESDIEELLIRIRPVPSERFHQNMRHAAWRMGKGQPMAKKNLSWKLAIAILVLATLAAFLITPQGRAWAQDIMQLFRKINSNTVQLPDAQLKQINELNDQYDLPLVHVFIPPVSPEMRAISGCETPQKSESYSCQVALAESKLGFDLKEFPEQPTDWEFRSLSFDRDSQYAVMSYDLDIRHISGVSSGSLGLIQGIGKFSDLYGNNPWDAVPADKVESVSIAAYRGEYVRGGFALQPGHTALTWLDDQRQRLIWSEGARWYLIDLRPNPNVAGTMGKDQLIHLAESLVSSPVATSEPLDPAYLISISDAEKVSGLHLKAPTLLPMNINYSYARYSSSKQQVRLVYGENEEMTIQEWKGESNKPAGKYEIVRINGEVGYYDPAEGSESHLFLWWHKDGLNFQMDYNQSFGWHMDKAKMLSIAESMQDIDDFRKRMGGYYEQVALYEQALGIRAKKFSEAPAGWAFTNFWSDVYAQCIDLIYAATTGQGTLLIDQCKTDKHSGPSAFPSQSIAQANVGNAQGRFVAGGFVLADNGKQVWDSTSPQKQLYWQEDGLWMRIAVTGEAALLSDKEDLISYAESLK